MRSEDQLFPGDVPPGAYPPSGHAHFDGRYVYDHEAPPRPLLPGTFPREHQRQAHNGELGFAVVVEEVYTFTLLPSSSALLQTPEC